MLVDATNPIEGKAQFGMFFFRNESFSDVFQVRIILSDERIEVKLVGIFIKMADY